MRPHFPRTVLFLAAAWLAVVPEGASSQLISPGKLSRAHEELEGLRKCTTCHQLGSRGSDDGRCLDCHTPLAEQIDKGRGLHVTFDEPTCAACHKEHFGVDFDVLRFPPLTFDHATAGYDLLGAHEDLRCRQCHNEELIRNPTLSDFRAEHGSSGTTYLGLGTDCLACHLADDPHAGQFGDEGCTACHGQEGWTPAPGFDHDETRYPLTGRHGNVACSDCHSEVASPSGVRYVRYARTEYASCLSCHTDTQHRGAMGNDCAACHSTASWTRISARFEGSFDHGSTGFDLLGAHPLVPCGSCHGQPSQQPEGIVISFVSGARGATYPRPDVQGEADCLACHVDYHLGRFRESTGGPVCSSCHDDRAWLPTSFDLTRHGPETTFPLTGAHVVTPCSGCHLNPTLGHESFAFTISDTSCRACHETTDPHQGQFEDGCEACHDTESFRIRDFDHDRTRYPLDGRHRDAPCASCHETPSGAGGEPAVRYKPLAFECTDCHGSLD